MSLLRENESLDEAIKRIFGEQNLYKIDRFKYPDKRCRHNEIAYCVKCRDEIDNEINP